MNCLATVLQQAGNALHPDRWGKQMERVVGSGQTAYCFLFFLPLLYALS
jgi:hypothetical protein